MTQTVNPGLLIAGFRGKFYLGDGTPFAAISSWELTENYSNSDTQPVGSMVGIAVTQVVTFTLNFTEITIEDSLPVARLNAVRTNSQIDLRFIGEVERPDGKIGRYVANHCVPDGNFRTAGANPGDTMTRDHSYRVNEIPDIASALG